MSDQFNNQRCNKCNSKYVYPEQNKFTSGCGDHEHFIKKNGKLFCVDCLISEGHVKCSRCHKLITHRGEKDIPTRVVFLSEHEHCCDLDKYPSTFSYSCESCWSSGRPHFRNKCKISFCSQKSEYDCEDLCKHHSKPCQGTCYGKKCNFPIESNGGDFCKFCQNRTEKDEQEWEKLVQIQKKAQNWWDTLSSSEQEKECERVVKNLKLGEYEGGKMWRGNKDMEGYGAGWAHDGSFWQIKNGKYVSSQPHLVPFEIVEEFIKKEVGDNLSIRNYKVVKKDGNSKDNSPSPNPSVPSPQPITNSNDESDDSANPGNSPSMSEEKNSKEDNTTKSTENSPIKTDNQTLISQHLRDIKQVTLTAEGNLVIEFNGEKLENGDSISQNQQVITSEQINNSQELQKIRNYCQRNNKSVLSQQELNSLINANKTSAPTNKTKDDNNNALGIGLVVVLALIVGLVIGLVVKRKKRN